MRSDLVSAYQRGERLKRVEQFEIAGMWPHVLQVDGGWNGILRSFHDDTVIKWNCGHTHVTQRDARSCAYWRFNRRLEKVGGSA